MSLTDASAERIRARRDYLRANRHRLVIDGDVHPTRWEDLPADHQRRIDSSDRYFHGRALLTTDLVPLMDRAGVDMAVCWQNPAALPYTEDRAENARRLEHANAAIAELAHQHPQRVIPAGWTDPKALGVEAAVALARKCVLEFGMPIVKLNPAQNSYPIDCPMVMTVVDAIVALGAVPAFHFGSDTVFTPPAGLGRVAARHPDHPVIGVHMGGGGGNFVDAEPIYQGAVQLGLDQPNIFFVLSALREVYAETAIATYARAGRPSSANLALGSDAPYCSMVWVFGGARAFMAHHTFDRAEDRTDIMGGNLADLVARADTTILARAT